MLASLTLSLGGLTLYMTWKIVWYPFILVPGPHSRTHALTHSLTQLFTRSAGKIRHGGKPVTDIVPCHWFCASALSLVLVF